MNRILKIVLFILLLFLLGILLAPIPSFRAPLSTVVEASDGTLLGARVAADGQWRFPSPDSLPGKYVTCLINYEDRYFRLHPGVNPVALFRALVTNIRSGAIVSGGSTITMQVARMARGNPRRTYGGKLIEVFSAMKLELFRSKRAILSLYAAHAPFGGNTVGIEAAAWRYTGRGIADLSWADAAMLAVLPNAPSSTWPGRRSDQLRIKRDRLLMTLEQRGIIDSLTCSLAMGEPLPSAPQPMPSLAPHLTTRLWLQGEATGKGSSSAGRQPTKPGNKSQKQLPAVRFRTTVDPHLQREVTDLVNMHQRQLEANGVHNAAAVVVEVASGNVLAYVGNSTLADTAGKHGRYVDMIMAPRSTGSIMKPFLYAGLLSSGMLLPNALVPDIPTRFQGFRPENSDFSYSGAVPAGDALARSLNIPAVRMLQTYEPERFHTLLHRMGFSTFTRPASHYGLSLILGGGEASLWELTGAYASMARVLAATPENRRNRNYPPSETWHMPLLTAADAPHNDPAISRIAQMPDDKDATSPPTPSPLPSAPAIWLTYEALLRVNRPESETGWQYLSGASGVAWKTGTSYGFRDAWAIGTTPDYVIGVWAGNADGEGRPGLTGITSAAPLLFDIIRLLPRSSAWFARPEEGMVLAEVCASSGYRAGPNCTETREEWITEAGLRSDACPYHTVVTLDNTGRYRVNSSCATPGEMTAQSWFVLPPAMEYYYRMRNPSYRSLPPFRKGCSDDNSVPVMEFIYPPRDARIFIPRGLSGEAMSMLPEIAHRRRNATIYWHLDDKFIGTTRHFHQAEIRAGSGEHTITAVDDEGATISRRFYSIESF